MLDRIFVVGKGLSLQEFNFKKLEDEFTLAVGSACTWFTPTAVYMANKETHKKLKPALEDFKGIVYGGKRTGKMKKFSGLAALDVALKIAHKVYLLGYDMHRVDGNPYAFPETGDQAEYSYRLTGWIEARAKLFDKYFNDYKDRVYNCNPESNIDTFKFVDIEEVLDEV